ncbi:MAG: alpha/beta fold hydrolase [Bacteroidota bacterium]
MKKKIAIFISGFLLLLIGLNACMQYREATSFILERFPEAQVKVVDYQGRNIRYMTLHRNDTFPTLFFLHGSPSSMSVYNVYYEDEQLAQWANIIAADRPGYGFSDLGRSEKSVRRQAESMWKILENEGFPSPLYIIGSSYGGTVAAKMAMLHPDQVDGMVLVSASLAPGKEKTYNISYLLQHPPFRWILPGMIRVANDEKLSHFEALNEMVPYWYRITNPVIMLQGARDRLIYPENVDFARSKLTNSRFVEYHLLEEEGHFLQIKYREFILERLKWLILNGDEETQPQVLEMISQ